MHIKEALRVVGGSIAVYVIMTACSSGGGAGPVGPGGPDGGSFVDALAYDVVSALDGLSGLDGPGSPVPDAQADGNTSGSRLKAKRYIGTDGSSEFIGWHDSLRNEDCAFRTSGDGQVRCLPSGAGTGSYYSDATCTNAIVPVGPGCVPAYVTTAVYGSSCAGLTAETHVFQVGPKFTGANVWTQSGTCTPMPTPSMTDFYAVGGEVAPSSFVAATLQIDP
jgi:hypothetical protein